MYFLSLKATEAAQFSKMVDAGNTQLLKSPLSTSLLSDSKSESLRQQ